MRTIGGTKALMGGLLCLAAGWNVSLADIPAAMDRVPAGTPVSIAIRDLEAFKARVMGMAEKLQLPMPGDAKEKLEGVLKMEGLNRKGSLALAITPPKEEGMGEGTVVMIVPVTDAAAVIKSMGGEGAGKVTKVKMPGGDKDGFAKDIGGGYLAISDTQEATEKFEGKGGAKGSHEKALGAAGKRIGDAAEVLIVADIQAMHDQLAKGVAEMKEQMDGMAAMMGEQGAQMQSGLKIMSAVADAFVRDGQVGVVGLSMDEKGVNLDFGANFKGDSASAKLMTGEGHSSRLMSRLPAGSFLFAAAMDWSAPGMRAMIRNAGEMSKAAGAQASPMGGFDQWAKMMEFADGQAYYMGASDLGAGLLANSSYYFPSKDSKKLGESYKAMMMEMNGKKQQGVTFKVDYKDNAKDIGGAKASSYSLAFEMDPNDPAAAQAQMMMPMLFGPEGKMSGFVTSFDGGMVGTMSQNSELLTKALDAAKSGKGLMDDALVKQTAERLPGDRSMELFVGTKAILDTVQGFMAMMGGGGEMQVPEQLAPIGVGLSTLGGGAQARVHVPTDVIKTFVDMGKKAGAHGDGMDEDAGTTKPKF